MRTAAARPRPAPAGRTPALRTPLQLLAIALVAAACGGDDGPGGPESQQLPLPPPLHAPAGLEAVSAVPVEGWTGPGETVFEVRTRSTDLELYPCAACHASGAVSAGDRADDAHRDIRLLHPTTAGADCSTCHVPGRPDSLAVHGRGAVVSLDHAYATCAQCHFSEARTWAGGAHGKRVEGWAGRRVVYNCADCHNPHAPAFDRRIPFPGPRIP